MIWRMVQQKQGGGSIQNPSKMPSPTSRSMRICCCRCSKPSMPRTPVLFIDPEPAFTCAKRAWDLNQKAPHGRYVMERIWVKAPPLGWICSVASSVAWYCSINSWHQLKRFCRRSARQDRRSHLIGCCEINTWQNSSLIQTVDGYLEGKLQE